MSTASETTQVRNNTGQTDNVAPFTDDYIGALVDDLGVSGASASVWESLAAMYSTKVDVQEAGASHKFSDLFKNAKIMADYWTKKAESEIEVATNGTPRVTAIVRTT